MIKLETLKRGVKSGFDTLFILAKIIIPVNIFVSILKYVGLVNLLAEFFRPLMKVFGLPGEAAIVLAFGNMVNIYAAIGAITTITLTSKQVTIIAIMLSFSHSLFIETAVSKRIGVSSVLIVGIRIGLAILSGIFVNLIL